MRQRGDRGDKVVLKTPGSGAKEFRSYRDKTQSGRQKICVVGGTAEDRKSPHR